MGLTPDALPEFPWDALAPHRAVAAAHPDGIVDLSVGTPVDPSPEVARAALTAAADAPGYPAAHGTPELRQAVSRWFARRRGVPGVDPGNVLPTVGSKEFVAWLPALLGLGPGDAVVRPAIAYPTYEVGARLVGAASVPSDDPEEWGRRRDVRLVWVNSPSNPTGAVLPRERLAAVVAAARERGAVVASDECYAELAWEEPYAAEGVPSILDPSVAGDSHDGILAAYSLSKQSNLAGYRAAFVAGDARIVARLLELRRHLGMIVPAPVQAATAALLDDDAHVATQRARYGERRRVLLAGLEAAGLEVAPAEAGLYLWASRGEDAWKTVARLARLGILVAPGHFYGDGGARHVRASLTASDERLEAAVRRLSASG